MLRATWGPLAALLLLAGSSPALSPVATPLPANGDFLLGSTNWDAVGRARVAEGQGEVGQAGCYGAEDAFVLGRLTTIAGAPLARGVVLEYDYTITTADPDRLAGLRVVAVTQVDRVALDVFNPHTGPGCATHTGHRAVALDVADPKYLYTRLEFHVWGDAEGDLFLARVDNVRLSVAS